MLYRGFVLTIEGGLWVAHLKGSFVDAGSKAYLFEVLDRLAV
jgi:hypothetical protein